MIKAWEIRIRGTVQGVGFRPFIYIAAKNHKLCGYVINRGGEVFIYIEGNSNNFDRFFDYILCNYPREAKIDFIEVIETDVLGYKDFRIKESVYDEEATIGISPDIGICDNCKEDMLDPNSRYYLYPFTSCAKCGPRFTIIYNLPYDRHNTTMRPFIMCEECEEEYRNPEDRRYHAQTISCPKCGPAVKLINKNGKEIEGPPFQNARNLLKKGKILGVKGIGGYHIICDATCEDIITRLREKKNRYYKPFAVMLRDIEITRKHCYVSEDEEKLLLSRQKPIVLLRQRDNSTISRNVNPGLNKLGVMLPYSGIHLMLFDQQIEALVVTSGNISGFPLITIDEKAFEYLGNIVDVFLIHDRDILGPCDDSVSRVIRKRYQVIRGARGYAPVSIYLKGFKAPVLACGADLKNTFCILKDEKAYISQYLGDLDKLEALNVYKEMIERYKKLLNFEPKVVACDMHPDYISTRYAEWLGLRIIKVQHHHAHIASVLAENNFNKEVIGVAFDGTGYGPDGTVWGGEFLIASFNDFQRVGYLRQVPLPGGEKAVKEPWRMAGIYLQDAYGDDWMNMRIDCIKKLQVYDWETIWKSVKLGLNTLLTSSAGRLFDAVAAILGICHFNDYEGQAAQELEAVVDLTNLDLYDFEIKEEQFFILDFRETIKGIVEDIQKCVNIGIISAKFHNTVCTAISETCKRIRNYKGLNTVVLSGGVFQNQILLERTIDLLGSSGFKVLINSVVPCNDGGISLGQAVVAAKQRTKTKQFS